jgi:hypothetical protein
MNEFGVRAIAKTEKELGLRDRVKVHIGHEPILNVPDYTKEGQNIEKIKFDIKSNKEEKEMLLKPFSSEPEKIEDFQYVKPIRLTTAEDLINFIKMKG